MSGVNTKRPRAAAVLVGLAMLRMARNKFISAAEGVTVNRIDEAIKCAEARLRQLNEEPESAK